MLSLETGWRAPESERAAAAGRWRWASSESVEASWPASMTAAQIRARRGESDMANAGLIGIGVSGGRNVGSSDCLTDGTL